MNEIRGTQDDAVNHLLNIIDGGRERRARDEAAVSKLLAVNPSNERSTTIEDERVRLLVDMTNRELAKQQR